MRKLLSLILICSSFSIFAQEVTQMAKEKIEEVKEAIVKDTDVIENKTIKTVFYLVSNGEKKAPTEQYPDPYLSDEGLKRAQNWAKVLSNVKIDAIYAQGSISIKQTAQTVATSKELGVYALEANSITDDGFKFNTTGKSTLIVGDNATIVKFANATLEGEVYTVSKDINYSNLYIVTVTNGVKDSLLLDIE